MLASYRALCAATVAVTGRTFSGATHSKHSVEEAITYISRVFSNYKTASGIERFYGKVAEIGPGDSAGVGLLFLADGCTQVDLIDRFFSGREQQHQELIHRAIVQRFPQLGSLLRDGLYHETSFTGLSRQYGRLAAGEKFFSTNTGYDFIVSCAVLEHVAEPLKVISSAAAALNPGGMMLHQVDCRDHGQFSDSFHELKFLELPGYLYAPLKWAGGPNRVRLSSYIQTLDQLTLRYKVFVTSLAGVSESVAHWTPIDQIPKPLFEESRRYVASIRSQLTYPFRDMDDKDLMITSFMLVADSPSGR